MTYRLIADSGSTKTDWALLAADQAPIVFTTSGLNPVTHTDDEVRAVLTSQLLPHLQDHPLKEVDFYGAGCRKAQEPRMRELLSTTLGVANVSVASDLLLAARALCGPSEGIACILGTGANSCLFSGAEIKQNVPALGYILGDEGSGTALGRRFLADLFKQQLPADIVQAFHDAYPEATVDAVINRVYKQPQPNRYLASFAPFLHRHAAHPAVAQILREEFLRFFARNIRPYHRPDLPVHFVGSIAHHFEPQLRAAAQSSSITIGTILQRPFDRLANL